MHNQREFIVVAVHQMLRDCDSISQVTSAVLVALIDAGLTTSDIEAAIERWRKP